ncbi:hypothetical protein CD116_10165 [Staphylococcus schweitzeri]|uniref:Membrane protein n=1 Tax=Staphylococcus schweitzeri TaxID=1654388 RepID=A0A2K4AFZ0_9STAP|nr:hypothetical protein [Staphylococcus schweitzeri]MBE2129363.1 hypothetical protein [Staphylococcus schweitzeri]PNZ49011.1 hypothetical protein CD116_10165 [Staphylococcus schweitzeri]CDR25505.1 membrane protein [Staphylococcus schweitzeri]CDR27599.1 membrane protein [Staphylococcus schweitzeri]CDR51234.1 membrane protein [Staphylococcus schweitzeri]
MGYIILFFLAGPIILAIGNLVIGPIFNKQTPLRIQVRSFVVGSMIYIILATIGYFLLLQGKL